MVLHGVSGNPTHQNYGARCPKIGACNFSTGSAEQGAAGGLHSQGGLHLVINLPFSICPLGWVGPTITSNTQWTIPPLLQTFASSAEVQHVIQMLNLLNLLTFASSEYICKFMSILTLLNLQNLLIE